MEFKTPVQQAPLLMAATLLSLTTSTGLIAQSDPAGPVKYRSPAERREAGLGTELFPGVNAFGLFEYEALRQQDTDIVAIGSRINEDIFTAQLGLEIEFNDWLLAEIVAQTERDQGYHSMFEEIFVEAEFDVIGLSVGRQFVPFGEYFSYFITGPSLEFGETSGDSLIVDTELNDSVDLFGYALRAHSNDGSNATSGLEWGVGLEYRNADESIQFGFSYLSDLTEGDETFLQELGAAGELEALAGINSYVLYGMGWGEVTAEVVSAVRSFELDDERLKPLAYSLEASWFVSDDIQISIRYEDGKDLVDEVEQRLGLAMSWNPLDILTLTMEYLDGEYSRFSYSDQDIQLDKQRILSFQASMEF